MKNTSFPGLWSGLALLCLAACAIAQPATPPNMATPIQVEYLDAAAFAEWENGAETAIAGADRSRTPQWVVWSEKGWPGHNGLWFGESKTPGARHLRIGFKTPLSVGTVLARGGGQLSVLKAGSAYPGALHDETQWLPAQRLVNGAPSRAAVANDNYALWTLPAGTTTRALRFTHTADAADNRYAGWLGGVFVMSDRLVNLAPQGVAAASSNNQHAARINNGTNDGTWQAWDNHATDGSPVISSERPQWVLMHWPSPVRLSGLIGLWAGFGATDAQIYTGPADRHPRDAAESDWRTIKSFSGLKNGYPTQLWPNRLDFGQTVTTRAIRLRLTAPTEEGHPHLNKRTLGGKRVWLGELMALQSLDNAPLPTIELAAMATNAPHPPIPVRFTLKEAGYVTLVIEGMSGKRVRNLVSETYFPAGANVAWWDGTNDLGRDVDAARHGLYKIPAQFVEPGQYRVRGLVRGALGLHYEFSIYAEGNPPWTTPDTTGGWLTNHSAPQAALFVPGDRAPGGKPLVYLGSYVSEGGSGLAWVDLEGRKQGGRGWIGGNWTAAPYLAGDTGPQALPDIYAYVGSVWETAKGSAKAELRITALTAKEDKPILRYEFDAKSTHMEDEISGLAVRDGIIVVSLPLQKQLLFVDARAGKLLGTAPLEDPRGLAFDNQGGLLTLSGSKLLRFPQAQVALGTPQTVIAAGLEAPQHVALDAAGNIYVSDRGQSHQIKVFTPPSPPSQGGAQGGYKLLRAIGKPGVPKAGPYDPLHMNNPAGLSIDSKNQLWVTENDFLPKRVSVWTTEGQLIKAFYGPGKYGGGGTLDASDKTRFYYADEGRGTMEFRLDWQKGDSRLANVLYRPAPGDLKLAFRSAAPETALYREGRRYFTNCYNSSPTGGHGTAFLFLEKDGIARPVAAAGRANEWDVLKGDAFQPSWPAGVDFKSKNNNQAFFIWSDANGDADVQPGEVSWQPGASGGVTVMADLSFCVSRLNGKAMQFAPVGFATGGGPRYDLAKGQVLAENVANPASSGGDQILAGDGGLTIVTLGVKPFHSHSISGLKNGVPLWSYPNPWPGLHASHEAAKPDHPGQVIGATRLLGGLLSPKGSDAGQLWAVNGNMGNMYVFTADGLFVATLFEDVRQGKLWRMPLARRNMKLENISLHDENFWPTWTQTPDGQIYVQDGANTSLVRVDGLKTIRRLPEMPLRVSADDLKSAQTYLVTAEALRQQAQGRGVLEVALHGAAPVVDGKLDDWAGAAWVDIDKSGVGANFNSDSKPYDITAAVAIAGDRLYAAFRTGDAKLLQNSGEMPTAPFKTGGALDVMLGTNPKADPKRADPVEGDLRLLVTQVKGKPFALVYRAVVPGTKTPVPFASPWRTITLDRVDDVSAQVQLAGADGNYEISIPLAALGLQAQAGLDLQGDIGVLRGDGTQTTARTYWSNKATGITADVPSEAMLTPQLWGKWEFKAAP